MKSKLELRFDAVAAREDVELEGTRCGPDSVHPAPPAPVLDDEAVVVLGAGLPSDTILFGGGALVARVVRIGFVNGGGPIPIPFLCEL